MDAGAHPVGIAGPVLFTAGFLVLGFVRPGGYDPVAQQVSDLTAGRYGWAQQVNFVVFGLVLIAFAAAVHLGVRAARTGLWGPAILALNGAELVVAGLFPLSEDVAGTAYDPIGVHSMNGRIFFASIGIALVVTSVRLRADPGWRSLASYTLVTGIALFVLFVIAAVLAVPPEAPLHPWLGLVQRLVPAVWLPCIILLTVRLRRTT